MMLYFRIVFLLTFVFWASETLAQAEFEYYYDELDQLSKVVDSSGVVVDYVFDDVGNILEIKRSTVGGFAIIDYSPREGINGSTVTISGRGFSATPSENIVRFGDAVATVSSATATELLVIVPEGAITGSIDVSVGGTTISTVGIFSILHTPSIASINPKFVISGSRIDQLIINGSNLSAASYSFVPEFSPPVLVIDSSIVGPDGKSAICLLYTSDAADE